MLKRDITYEDFNGQSVTETFYFNLTQTEILEMEVGYEGGLEAAMKRIVEANDSKQIIAEFKKIILFAYGQKSEDGKRFIKNDELREAFSQTAAYDTLFIELATNDEKASEFMLGILPKQVAGEVAKTVAANQAALAPPPIQSVPSEPS